MLKQFPIKNTKFNKLPKFLLEIPWQNRMIRIGDNIYLHKYKDSSGNTWNRKDNYEHFRDPLDPVKPFKFRKLEGYSIWTILDSAFRTKVFLKLKFHITGEICVDEIIYYAFKSEIGEKIIPIAQEEEKQILELLTSIYA